MKEMKYDKGGDDRTSQHHGPRCPTRNNVSAFHISDRSSLSLDCTQLNGRPGVQDYRDEQNYPNCPEQWRISVQRFGIVVHHGGAEKNLKITKHMRDQKSKKHQAGNRHDGLLTNGGFVEPRNSHQLGICDYSAHYDHLSKQTIVPKKRIRVIRLIGSYIIFNR